MANKTFVQNSVFTIADNEMEAVGASVIGQEIVKIRAGVTGVKLDANFERVELTGALATYKFIVVSGTGLQIQNVSDSAVVATIPNINQSVKIAFADGSATLAQSGSSAFTLNTVALATGTAVTPTLTGGNVLTTSDVSNFQPSLVTVLTSAVTPFLGSTFDADTLDVGALVLSTTVNNGITTGAVLNGGLGGSGLPNTLAVKDNANISGGVISNFTNLLFDATGVSGTNDLTMTAAQHAGFTGVITATGTSGEKITLTTIATGLSLFPAVENYTLGDFVNSVTQTAVGQAITGNAGIDTVTAITGVTSTSDLLVGANVVIVPNGANISAGTFSATGGTVGYNVDSAATGTLTPAQQALISSASGTQSLTLSAVTTAAATLNASVETFTLANATNSVTQGAVGQIIIGDAGADTVTAITGVTSTSDLKAGTNVVVVPNGANISAGTFSATGGTVTLNLNGATTATLKAAQASEAAISAATGTNNVTISDVMTGVTLDVDVETYTLANQANTVTLGTAAGSLAQNVVGGSSTDVLTLGAGVYTGNWTSVSGLSLVTGNTSIAGVNAGAVIAGTPTLLITGGGNATMTAAQYQGLGTITAAGTDTVTFSTAITGSATGVTDIESYVLAGSTTNAFTLDKAAETVTASAGADNINVIALPSANTILVGLAAADTITTATGANLAVAKYHATSAASGAVGAATGAGILSFVGTTTLTAAQIAGFTTLTGTSTPILALTTAITTAMLDNAVVTNSLTTIKLADIASNVITAANATVPSTNVLIIDGSSLATNAFTFTGTAENTGTFNITGGAQIDTLTGSATTAAGDVFNYNTTAALVASNAVVDLVDGGAGALDELRLTNVDTGNALTIATGDALTRISNVEKITAGSSAGVISITRPATTNTQFTTIDLSGDINTAGTNVISNTGSNAITTIIGSAGIDQITLGVAAPATTITGGAGADTLSNSTVNTVTISDVDGITITMGAVANTTTVMTGALLATVITGGSGVDAITLAGSVSNVATIKGGDGVDVITLGAAHTGGVSVDISPVVASVNKDGVTNFISGVDKVLLGISNTTVATATATAAVTQSSTITQLTAAADFNLAGLAATNTKDLYILAGGNEVTANLGGSDTGAELLKYLGTAGNAATGLTVTATTNKFYIAAYDAGNTYLYYVVEGDTAQDTSASSADIKLVGTLTGTATVTAADFSMLT